MNDKKSLVFFSISTGLGLLASALAFVIFPFITLRATGSEAAVAYVVFAGSVPRFLASFLGSIVDRYSSKGFFTAVSLVQAASLFAALWVSNAEVSTALSTLLICTANFLLGVSGVIIGTAIGTLVPHWVSSQELPRANSLVVFMNTLLPLLGYGLSALLAGELGNQALLTGAAVIATLRIFPLLFVRFPRDVYSRSEAESGMWVSDFFRNSVVLYFIFLTFVLHLADGLIDARIPVFIGKMGAGPSGYGLFQGLLTTGLILGTAASYLMPPKSARRSLASGFFLVGAGIALFAFQRLVLLLTGAFAIGLGVALVEVMGMTLLQQLAPDHARGKVLGGVLTVNAAGSSLGALFAAGVTGVSGLWLFGSLGMGIAFLGMIGFWWLTRNPLIPSQVDYFHGPRQEATQVPPERETPPPPG
jgi:MFS family permease